MKMSKDDIIREEIIAAAKRVFQKWGLKKATMEEIAAEAGKAKSTLYYYYQSKEEIFDEAIFAHLAMILADVKAGLTAGLPVKEKIKRYVAVSLTEMKHHAQIYSIVWDEIKNNRRLLRKLRERLQQEERIFYREMLESGVQSGEFVFSSDKELIAAAHTLAGLMRALILYLFLEAEESEQIDIAARLIASGI